MSERPTLASGPREENGKCKELLFHSSSRKLAQLSQAASKVAVYDGARLRRYTIERLGGFESLNENEKLGAFKPQYISKLSLHERTGGAG